MRFAALTTVLSFVLCAIALPTPGPNPRTDTDGVQTLVARYETGT